MQRLLLICTFLYTFPIWQSRIQIWMKFLQRRRPRRYHDSAPRDCLSLQLSRTRRIFIVSRRYHYSAPTIHNPSSLVLGATITVHPAPKPTLLLLFQLSRSFRKGCFPCISKFRCLSNQVRSGLSWHILNLSWYHVCILFWSATRHREFVNARRTKKGPS